MDSGFLDEGLNRLKEKPRTERPSFLSNQERQQLTKYIEDNAAKPDGGRLTGHDIHNYITQTFGNSIQPRLHLYIAQKNGFFMGNLSLKAP